MTVTKFVFINVCMFGYMALTALQVNGQDVTATNVTDSRYVQLEWVYTISDSAMVFKDHSVNSVGPACRLLDGFEGVVVEIRAQLSGFYGVENGQVSMFTQPTVFGGDAELLNDGQIQIEDAMNNLMLFETCVAFGNDIEIDLEVSFIDQKQLQGPFYTIHLFKGDDVFDGIRMSSPSSATREPAESATQQQALQSVTIERASSLSFDDISATYTVPPYVNSFVDYFTDAGERYSYRISVLTNTGARRVIGTASIVAGSEVVNPLFDRVDIPIGRVAAGNKNGSATSCAPPRGNGSNTSFGGSRAIGAMWSPVDESGNVKLLVPLSSTQCRNDLFQNMPGALMLNDIMDPVTPLPWMTAYESEGAVWGELNPDADSVSIWVSNLSATSEMYTMQNGALNDAPNPITTISTLPGHSLHDAAYVDADNDGDLDLFVTNRNPSAEPNLFFLKTGPQDYDLESASANLSELFQSTSAVFADYDNDGDQDVYVINSVSSEANQFYRNTFETTGVASFELLSSGQIQTPGTTLRMVEPDTFLSQGASWGDADNDGDLDLVVFNSSTGCDATDTTPTIDGTNWLFENRLMQDGEPLFTTHMLPGSLMGYPAGCESSVSGTWVDYDNDGLLDIVSTAEVPKNLVVCGATSSIGTLLRPRLLENNGQLSFSMFAQCGDFETYTSGLRGLSTADVDWDGDIDVFVADYSQSTSPLFVNRLYTEAASSSNTWLRVRLTGSCSNSVGCNGEASNRMAIGARVTLVAQLNGTGDPQTLSREVTTLTGSRGQNSLDVHFGLGEGPSLISLEVKWPSGTVTTINDSALLQSYLKGVLEIREHQVEVPIQVFLEGPYSSVQGKMIRNADFEVPATQPYDESIFNGTPAEHDGAEQTELFNESDIIDWVMVELRSGPNKSDFIASRAALLREDGVVVDTDGAEAVRFIDVPSGSYHVAIHYRNHLAVMTADVVSLARDAGTSTPVDFTSSLNDIYGTASTRIKGVLSSGNTVYVLPTGNTNADKEIDDMNDRDLFGAAFNSCNYMDCTYDQADFNLNGEVDSIEFMTYTSNAVVGYRSEVPD